MSLVKSRQEDGKQLTKHLQTWYKTLQMSKENFYKRWSEAINDIGCLNEFDLGKYIDSGAFGHVFIVSIPTLYYFTTNI